VHYIRKHLLNRTIKTCQAFDDEIVYGKVGTSASAFSKALEGRRVTGADQQGKYFYVTFDKPPHAVMHFGMTGWMKFNVEDTAYYKQAKEEEGKPQEWPPKFMKFLWKCDAEGDKEACEVAFVDARRLGRIRLVDCEADKIRDATPLKENGPDPVRDKDILTVDWLSALTKRKRVPIKALLLDQANISGVGNWVADEILYQARIHPEQYSNTFSDAQIKALHDALISVCTIAVETLADTKKFPDDWIMKYRWDKGKKDSNVMPNGEKIVHITVGGRTSAVVPSRQKKTGAVAGDVDEADLDDEKPAKGKKRKSTADEDEDEKPVAKKAGRGKKNAVTNGVKDEEDEPQVNGGAEVEPPAKKGRGSTKSTPKKAEKPVTPSSRRSTRAKAK
jgi:formamidopyrimidine-DNA glycosylase